MKLRDLMPFIGDHEVQLSNVAQICGVSTFSVISKQKAMLFVPSLNIPEYTIGLVAEHPAWNMMDFGKQIDAPIEHIYVSETGEHTTLGLSTIDQWEDCLYEFPRYLVLVRLEKPV